MALKSIYLLESLSRKCSRLGVSKEIRKRKRKSSLIQRNETKLLQTTRKDLAKRPRVLEIMVLQVARSTNGAPKLSVVVLTKLAGNVVVDHVVNYMLNILRLS